MDDLTKKKPLDALHINLSEPYEVAYWCGALSCTEARLRKAVADVRTWLKNN